MSFDPLSALGSSINATIKILEVTYQLKAVDEQTANLLSNTRHVDFMVQEARRLRRLKAGLLNTNERAMIDQVIADTEDALRAVAKLVESCRVDKATKKSIGFGHRVLWVFRDNPSVEDKHRKLQVCCQSLTVVFNCLYSKDVVVIAPAPEATSEEQPPPPYDPQMKELLDWRNRRKGRRSVGGQRSHSTENLSLMNTGSNDGPVAGGPSTPCLLAIPLKDNGEAPGLSTPNSEMSFELPSMSQLEIKPSASHGNHNRLSPSHSPPINANPPDEVRSTPSTPYTNDHTSRADYLPELDTSALATMIAPYTFRNNDEKSALEHHTPTSFPPRDRTPSNISQPPSTDPQIPSPPQPTASHPTPPPPLRSHSATPQHTSYRADRLDALARATDAMAKENNNSAAGRGAVVGRRGGGGGGRSWLAYHATRSDLGGHGMG